MISERRTDDGGTVAVYADITELKQREEELDKKSTALAVCRECRARYCSGTCYHSLDKETTGSHWWTRSTVRLCRECGGVVRRPDPGPWPY